jgi:hypothetical protein
MPESINPMLESTLFLSQGLWMWPLLVENITEQFSYQHISDNWVVYRSVLNLLKIYALRNIKYYCHGSYFYLYSKVRLDREMLLCFFATEPIVRFSRIKKNYSVQIYYTSRLHQHLYY